MVIVNPELAVATRRAGAEILNWCMRACQHEHPREAAGAELDAEGCAGNPGDINDLQRRARRAEPDPARRRQRSDRRVRGCAATQRPPPADAAEAAHRFYDYRARFSEGDGSSSTKGRPENAQPFAVARKHRSRVSDLCRWRARSAGPEMPVGNAA